MSTRELFKSQNRAAGSELVRRFGLPISAIMLSLMAIPLSYVNPRAGRSWGVVVALLVFLIYNNMQSVMQAWVGQGRISAAWGMWVVHAVVLGLFLVMVWRQLRVTKNWRLWR
jgi:lipopolysaccharide export system permease protein